MRSSGAWRSRKPEPRLALYHYERKTMTTKTITVKATELQGELGRPQGVPFRWLAGLVDDMRKRVPDDEEDSCRVHGAAGLTFTYEHKLTPVEVMQEQIDAYEVKAAQLRGLLQADGTLVPDAAAKLKKILG